MSQVGSHADWGTDPSGYCGCSDCKAPERVENTYAIKNGWVVEVVNEPGCGLVPLARVEDLVARFDTVAERLREALEVEWENGNLETGAFDRLEAIINDALGEA